MNRPYPPRPYPPRPYHASYCALYPHTQPLHCLVTPLRLYALPATTPHSSILSIPILYSITSMRYDPSRHHRRSIRLPNYDYSRAGYYFVTILVKNRACLLGSIEEGRVHLSEIGVVVEKTLKELPKRFPGVQLDAFIIMPNHVHVIIVITPEAEAAVRTHETRLTRMEAKAMTEEEARLHRRRMLLPKIIGFFKMNSAKQANRLRDAVGEPFWQRGYYEHIIRDEKSLHRIRAYIYNNPLKWHQDQIHPDVPSKW